MKISFILPGGGVSGGVRATVVAANYLIERGHKVGILVRKGTVSAREVYGYLTDNVVYSAHSWLKDFKGRLEKFRNIEIFRFEKEEIIVGVGSYVTGEMTQLQSLPNPKVQYLHGITTWDPDLMRRTLSLPMPKIAVASYLVPLIESNGGGSVLAVIPNGIDRNEYFMSVSDSEKNGVGTIYSSHAAKDPSTVIACLQSIARRVPGTPARVFGTERKPEQLPEALYWRLPSVREAREIYSKSLVWIVGSRSEGFSLPLLEAMSCGAVPVATDCGGTRDIIVDGENGFLVRAGDVDQIVDRTFLLLEDGVIRKRMRLAGHETVNRFSWDRSIDVLEETLNELLTKHKRGYTYI